MENAELKTTSIEDLLRFVEDSVPNLDRFWIEIRKDGDGVLVSELVAIEPTLETINV